MLRLGGMRLLASLQQGAEEPRRRPFDPFGKLPPEAGRQGRQAQDERGKRVPRPEGRRFNAKGAPIPEAAGFSPRCGRSSGERKGPRADREG